jgi:hypothetical protein
MEGSSVGYYIKEVICVVLSCLCRIHVCLSLLCFIKAWFGLYTNGKPLYIVLLTFIYLPLLYIYVYIYTRVCVWAFCKLEIDHCKYRILG